MWQLFDFLCDGGSANNGYPCFKRLYELFDKTLLGYLPNEDAHYLDMGAYYKDEDIKKYGVVGIEIEVIKTLDVDVFYQQNLDL